ncbi:MAG: long-chain fatty acid--CoA ligase [Alphaproteobacteria bacterium]|nr:long-chain fatty acid--CoA ligase [Alphaproteobacteria bacterium]
MNLARLILKTATATPSAAALARGARTVLDYRGLANRQARLARSLRERHGLAPGDRVGLVMKNCPEYLEAWCGVWHAGLAAVPINAKLHAKEIDYILGHSGARLCFATPDLAGAVGGALPVIEIGLADWRRSFEADALDLYPSAPTDLAWLFYTSGTTGRPKGAMLSHRNLLVMVLSYLADIDHIAPGDAVVHAAPLSHGSGCYGMPFFAKGGTHVIPDSGGFDPAEIFDLMPQLASATFFAAPTMVSRLIGHGAAGAADTRRLKTLIYGGGPMYVEDSVKALDLLGPKLHQIYGQGEAPMTITHLTKAQHALRDHPRWRAWLGSAGQARSDVEVKVVDERERELPAGEIGEVICRGEVVMAGYWDNPEASAKTLAGGWLHTGDMGAFDEQGFLTLKDRSKDMIISGGSNIYPREVEEVLLRHPAVREVSVVGRPHPDWGEEVVAFVVGQAREVELDQLCLDHIARFKRPKRYRFVAELPKNNYGKILKTRLREIMAAEDKTGR